MNDHLCALNALLRADLRYDLLQNCGGVVANTVFELRSTTGFPRTTYRFDRSGQEQRAIVCADLDRFFLGVKHGLVANSSVDAGRLLLH